MWQAELHGVPSFGAAKRSWPPVRARAKTQGRQGRRRSGWSDDRSHQTDAGVQVGLRLDAHSSPDPDQEGAVGGKPATAKRQHGSRQPRRHVPDRVGCSRRNPRPILAFHGRAGTASSRARRCLVCPLHGCRRVHDRRGLALAVSPLEGHGQGTGLLPWGSPAGARTMSRGCGRHLSCDGTWRRVDVVSEPTGGHRPSRVPPSGPVGTSSRPAYRPPSR